MAVIVSDEYSTAADCTTGAEWAEADIVVWHDVKYIEAEPMPEVAPKPIDRPWYRQGDKW